MKRAFQRWWKHFRERRAAFRRSSKNLRRPADAPFYYQTSFGRPRPGRFELRLRWRKYFRRALAMVCVFVAIWIFWQSWIGLGIFDN